MSKHTIRISKNCHYDDIIHQTNLKKIGLVGFIGIIIIIVICLILQYYNIIALNLNYYWLFLFLSIIPITLLIIGCFKTSKCIVKK